MKFSIGDYIVISLSLILAAVSLLDDMTTGFVGYAYSFGFFIGGFFACLFFGYVLLFAFRYVRSTFFSGVKE